MNKKQKQEWFDLFAKAFHEVVAPLFENMATKDDLKNFATKEDLKREIGAVREEMATKEDLKREMGFVRQDINDLRTEISTSPTRGEFEELKTKVNRLTN